MSFRWLSLISNIGVKMLKKLAVVIIIVIVLLCFGLATCMSTPPHILMQEDFSWAMNIFPEGAPIYVGTVKLNNNGNYMFRCIVKGENLQDFEPSQYDIGNVYFIASMGELSTEPHVVKGQYSICTNNPTQDNPLFVQFLKDNHWGEEYKGYEGLWNKNKLPEMFTEEDEGTLDELADKMAELVTGKKIGKTEEYVLGVIRSHSKSGKYYYGEFDLQKMTMKFIRINIGKETLKAYKESGEVTLSGVSLEDFDPQKFVQYVDEIRSNT